MLISFASLDGMLDDQRSVGTLLRPVMACYHCRQFRRTLYTAVLHLNLDRKVFCINDIVPLKRQRAGVAILQAASRVEGASKPR